jgi:phosphoribosylaminoimidazole (AIR) synthetase
MGWGFAIIVERTSQDRAIDLLEKMGAQTERIGHVTDSEGVKILHHGKIMILQ